VSEGIPFDLAFLLDDDTALGFLVILGQLKTGQEFDWAKKTFKEPK
jgi:hypothetical protein